MTLEVFTARIGTRDPDVLDVTRGSGKGIGLAFAPSEALLAPAIAARRAAQAKRRKADELAVSGGVGAAGVLQREADRAEDSAWAAYEPRYVAEMRVSYGLPPARRGALEQLAVERGVQPAPKAWQELLGRPRVVLVCYCTDPERCHRRLLARILARCGAVDRGELGGAREGAPGATASPRLAIAERDLKPENISESRAELAELVAAVGPLLEQLEESVAVGPSSWRPRP